MTLLDAFLFALAVGTGVPLGGLIAAGLVIVPLDIAGRIRQGRSVREGVALWWRYDLPGYLP